MKKLTAVQKRAQAQAEAEAEAQAQAKAKAQAELRARLQATMQAEVNQRSQKVEALKTVLRKFTSTDPDIVEQASAALLVAAENYQYSFPFVDEQGHRLREKVADARTATAKLRQQLVAARDTAQTLPIKAIEALTDKTGKSRAAFVRKLARQISVADAALASLNEQPNKAKDDHRVVLALAVAVIFRDILKLKPTSTRDTDSKLKPGSKAAAYARVLGCTLEVAGWLSVDLGPVIDRGLELLQNPRGIKRYPHLLRVSGRNSA